MVLSNGIHTDINMSGFGQVTRHPYRVVGAARCGRTNGLHEIAKNIQVMMLVGKSTDRRRMEFPWQTECCAECHFGNTTRHVLANSSTYEYPKEQTAIYEPNLQSDEP